MSNDALLDILKGREIDYCARPTSAETMTCAKCGATYGVGASPWCKDQHRAGANSIESVTWPGGKVFENLGHEAVRCDSPADLKRELKARGLEPMVRHIDGSPHTRSWATMDPYTLEAARVLAERQATSKVRARDDGPSAETVRVARDAFAEMR